MSVQTAIVKPQSGGGTIAPLRNVVLFDELLDRVVSRRKHLPGMGTFYGFSGLGKTFSATYGAQRHRALYVEVGESWTRAYFCKQLLTELGLRPRGTVPDMVGAIIKAMVDLERPLIIDEFDHVIKRGYVETVREIHDRSGAPIVLIGEELMPTKLQEWERFHNRILDQVAAQPTTFDDVGVLARLYVPGVEIATDLLEHVNKVSDGRVRRVIVNLEKVREACLLEGWDVVDLAMWGDRPLFSGAAPSARRVG